VTADCALGPAQALTLRPHLSCADTRTPVPGFYLGGGGVHPGVPGLLGAGMLAARAVMADRGLPLLHIYHRDGVQVARRRTSQMVAAMSSTDSASSQPPSIHWKGQNRLPG
jgi:hypothetical protein